ncbi:hypothetical protein C8Q75DRAFT_811896 [Abortiporus biennis]|nr:hypothetical protein C8Q75DRAFT_811896 [Abortiporus biennis]
MSTSSLCNHYKRHPRSEVARSTSGKSSYLPKLSPSPSLPSCPYPSCACARTRTTEYSSSFRYTPYPSSPVSLSFNHATPMPTSYTSSSSSSLPLAGYEPPHHRMARSSASKLAYYETNRNNPSNPRHHLHATSFNHETFLHDSSARSNPSKKRKRDHTQSRSHTHSSVYANGLTTFQLQSISTPIPTPWPKLPLPNVFVHGYNNNDNGNNILPGPSLSESNPLSPTFQPQTQTQTKDNSVVGPRPTPRPIEINPWKYHPRRYLDTLNDKDHIRVAEFLAQTSPLPSSSSSLPSVSQPEGLRLEKLRIPSTLERFDYKIYVESCKGLGIIPAQKDILRGVGEVGEGIREMTRRRRVARPYW